MTARSELNWSTGLRQYAKTGAELPKRNIDRASREFKGELLNRNEQDVMALPLSASRAERFAAKEKLLEEIRPLKRGLKATSEDRQRVEKLCKNLEQRNPTPKPVESSLLNGEWELLYTTSKKLLKRSQPVFMRSRGPTYQTLNVPAAGANHRETRPFFTEVVGDIVPLNASKLRMNHDTFKLLGFIPVKVPPGVGGELDVTYLDEDLRIHRDNYNAVYVLKMDDPTATA